TENGIKPLEYSVRNTKCGPDSGIIPINAANRINNNLF
ncbi:unnamed protein product, partial [marine sediment metagenome]